LILILFAPAWIGLSVCAETLADTGFRSIEILPGLIMEPALELEGRYFYYGSVPDASGYCLENSEGDCLTEGLSAFADLSAGGILGRRLTLGYTGQLSDQQHRTKRAFVLLQTGIVSWKFGKDSLWIGHGTHGSFLLSSHAEGFLMAKIETEEPFRLPGVLSKAGGFRYLLFHGWMDDFRLFGHRAEYWPVPVLQVGGNQTIFYEERFKATEFHRILSAAEENVPGRYDNDQRASVDMALYLPFLAQISPIIDGKLYAELAGEDLIAFWQKEDRGFVQPFGFNFLSKGAMGGLLLTTGATDFRLEYSQNYRGGDEWYQKFPFGHEGVPMGHHMGPEADDLFIEIGQALGPFVVRVAYDRERHGIHNNPDRPEVRDQFILVPSYTFRRIQFFANLIYAHYRNVDTNPDPFVIEIDPGTDRDEYTIGLGVAVR
jgi:hypothetical protein